MPVMCTLHAPGVTPADYKNVREHLAWEKDPPQGGLAHFIAFRDDGAIEVDIWEDERSFRAFYNGSFRPALRHFGLHVASLEIVELHNLAVAEDIQAHMVAKASARAPALA